MITEGIIKVYNEEKGFGFIQIEDNNKDLFFHIKDIPHRQYLPKIGEKLKFRIATDNDGRMKAENIIRIDIKVEEKSKTTDHRNPSRSSSKKYQKKSFNLMNSFIGIVMFSIFSFIIIPFISNTYQRESLKKQIVSPYVQNTSVTSKYTCDGRIHCSQMKSYDEAVFFIQNCPGTEMDGDSDGEPCEGQFR